MYYHGSWTKITNNNNDNDNDNNNSICRDANPPVFCGRLPFFPSISRLPVLLANLPIFRILKIIIIITDPDNRHYGNREKRYNQLITCQLVRFCDKSKLKRVQINSFALKFSPVIHPKS